MMRFLRILVVPLVSVVCTDLYAESLAKRAEKDSLAFMRDEEPAMKNAFKKARDTLDEFIEKSKAPPSGTTGYSVKVAVLDGEYTEYFWVGEFAESGPNFVGKINNQPRIVRTVRFGQSYEFNKSKIVDWTYIDQVNKKMIGNFTACALLTKEPPEEAVAMKKRFGLSCE